MGVAMASSVAVPSAGDVGGDAFLEKSRSVPFGGESDIIVAGGGPAGIAAAVTAARLGKSVRLFEAHGALGGIWTVGLLSCIIDFDHSDISREIISRLDALGARSPRRAKLLDRNFIYDPECMKVVLEDMATEAGVKFTYHSPVVAAYRNASGRGISAVVTESKSGRRAWRAPLFIDCTGDGDLAALAGCGFDTGGVRPGDPDQPASLMAIVTVDDDSRIGRFVVNDPSGFDAGGKATGNPKRALYGAFADVGVEPSYAAPTLFRIRRNLLALMANHEYAVKVDDADAITSATVRARREIFSLVRALASKGGPDWSGLRIVATAGQLGHRCARRIHGRYTLTGADVVGGSRFPDAVAECAFSMDVHAVTRAANRINAADAPAGMRHVRPYQIPLRACRAKDVDNLYMAGRCISGDFNAQASYRVTGTAVAMGEGVAKAVCGV